MMMGNVPSEALQLKDWKKSGWSGFLCEKSSGGDICLLTKSCRLSGLNSINVFSHSSGDQKSRTKVSSRLVSFETRLWAYSWLPSLCGCSPLCVPGPSSSLLVMTPVILDEGSL